MPNLSKSFSANEKHRSLSPALISSSLMVLERLSIDRDLKVQRKSWPVQGTQVDMLSWRQCSRRQLIGHASKLLLCLCCLFSDHVSLISEPDSAHIFADFNSQGASQEHVLCVLHGRIRTAWHAQRSTPQEVPATMVLRVVSGCSSRHWPCRNIHGPKSTELNLHAVGI